MKNRLISAVLALTMIAPAALASCGAESVSYASDIAVSQLITAADNALNYEETLTQVPDDYIRGMMEIDTSDFADHAVKIRASGTNIDEYGIFKAPDGVPVSDIEAIAQNYFKTRLDIWMDEYMPEEKPKLENAEIEVFGDYVVYCILDDASKDMVFDAVKSELTK